MPDNARAYYNLGQLLAFLHEDKGAVVALERTIEIEPGNMNYLQSIARFYLARRDFSRVKEIARQMIAAEPDNKTGHNLLHYANSLMP